LWHGTHVPWIAGGGQRGSAPSGTRKTSCSLVHFKEVESETYPGQKDVEVNRDYDLFEHLPDGSSQWRCHVQGLLEAHQKLLEVSKTTKNECFAMHLKTKEIVARASAGKSKRHDISAID
jgi:hypothetical protein